MRECLLLPACFVTQAELKQLKKEVKVLQDADEKFKMLDMLALLKSNLEGTGPGGDLRKFLKPRLPLLLRLLVGS